MEIPADWSDAEWVTAWLSQLSHLLPKGSYRSYKKKEENIVFITQAEHWLWHNESRENLERGDHGNAEKWIAMFKKRDELKAKANNVQP